MNIQNLIIFKLNSLYHILKEIGQELHFNIIEIQEENLLNNEIKNLKSFLIITRKELQHIDNQYVLEKIPIKISELIEKINIKFLRIQFSNQLEIKINKYLINLNARELTLNNKKLKLTEKEISIILYLSHKKNPITIKELQLNVWKYQSDIETHTVETHVYRLRKKIFKTFNDQNFIISKKNGYKIK